MRYFRNPLREFLFGLALLFDTLLDVDAARAKNHHGESSLIEFRNEVGAQVAEDEERKSEQRKRPKHNQPAQSQRESKYWSIKILEGADGEIVSLRDFAAKQKRAKSRH